MITATERSSLDAFIMEYLTYYNDSTLRGNYKFIPFGYKHESPLYTVGNVDDGKMILLKRFKEI